MKTFMIVPIIAMCMSSVHAQELQNNKAGSCMIRPPYALDPACKKGEFNQEVQQNKFWNSYYNTRFSTLYPLQNNKEARNGASKANNLQENTKNNATAGTGCKGGKC